MNFFEFFFIIFFLHGHWHVSAVFQVTFVQTQIIQET